MLPFLTQFAATCKGGGFFGFPPWYKYLDGTLTTNQDKITVCTPKISSLSDIWLIVAAIIEILLRLAALAAVTFLVVGGVRYLTSQGEPDKTKQALGTVISALVGLVIAVAAATIVSFVAGRFNS